jgi:hypothetical protein
LAIRAARRAGITHAVAILITQSDALRLKIEHDRRLRGIDDFIVAREAEYGEIADEEMDAAYRAARARAIVVRGGEIES